MRSALHSVHAFIAVYGSHVTHRDNRTVLEAEHRQLQEAGAQIL